MLESIGGTVVVYVVIAWLVSLFTGKGIIREYEINGEMKEYINREDDNAPRPDEHLPKNVIRFRQ